MQYNSQRTLRLTTVCTSPKYFANCSNSRFNASEAIAKSLPIEATPKCYHSLPFVAPTVLIRSVSGELGLVGYYSESPLNFHFEVTTEKWFIQSHNPLVAC